MRIKITITLLIIISTILISGCSSGKDEAQLSELQITACNSAHEGNTCDTKLEELGIVAKDNCCQILKKCC